MEKEDKVENKGLPSVDQPGKEEISLMLVTEVKKTFHQEADDVDSYRQTEFTENTNPDE